MNDSNPHAFFFAVVDAAVLAGVTDSVSQDGLQVDESVHDVLENMSLYELIRKLYECSKSVTQSSIFDSTIPFEEFQTRAMAVPISSLIGKMSRICKEN